MKQVCIIAAALIAGAVVAMSASCRRPTAAENASSENAAASNKEEKWQAGTFAPRPIGAVPAANQPAWITDLAIADLDQDGRSDVVACDARINRIVWLRQV